MRSAPIQRLLSCATDRSEIGRGVFGRARSAWGWRGHLPSMDTNRLTELGLEPMLTTSELAEYLGVNVQAIYDLRADGRGPTGVRVGRELRYRASDVRTWLEGLHEGSSVAAAPEGDEA